MEDLRSGSVASPLLMSLKLSKDLNEQRSMRLQATACLLITLLLPVGCTYKSQFTDRALEQRFRSNEADFNRLVKMFKEDSKLSGVNYASAYLSYDVKADLPRQRLDEYRSLLTKLSLRNVGEVKRPVIFISRRDMEVIS